MQTAPTVDRMLATLAREFVLVFEALAAVIGRTRATLDRAVQAARRRWKTASATG